MDRLDMTLDDIIADSKRKGGVRKNNKVTAVVVKRVKNANTALNMKRPINEKDGRIRHKDSTGVSSKYLDVDAPLVDVVQLSYGMDTLPLPSKKKFGSRKMERNY